MHCVIYIYMVDVQVRYGVGFSPVCARHCWPWEDLGTVEEEEFTLELLAWLSRFAEELVVDACVRGRGVPGLAGKCPGGRITDPDMSFIVRSRGLRAIGS